MIFEVLLNATAMFNHANARLPPGLDRRAAMVRGDAGHAPRAPLGRSSAKPNSNFGFNLPWWDHLFGTYRVQPAAGHSAMTIGVAGLSGPEELPIGRLLTQPFRTVGNDDALRRRVGTDALVTPPLIERRET